MNFSDQTVRRSTFCSYLSFSTIPITVEMEDQDTDVTSKGYQRRDCYQMLMREHLESVHTCSFLGGLIATCQGNEHSKINKCV